MIVEILLLWTLLVLALHLIAWIALPLAVGMCVLAVVGLVHGCLLPALVLTGRGTTTPHLVTPAEVAAGTVIRRRRRGASRYIGWDRAWPAYAPYQARHDRRCLHQEARVLAARRWAWVGRRRRVPSGSHGRARGRLLRWFRRQVGFMMYPPLYAAFWVGLWTAVLACEAVLLCLGAIVAVVCALTAFLYRSLDTVLLRRRRAGCCCPECYVVSPHPSYRCPGQGCAVVHHDVSPGPLGIFVRRCDCSATFRTTVRHASRHLVPVCPSCDARLPDGSGARQTIQLPVFGSVGAGKTRLLAALVTGADQRLAEGRGEVTPLDGDSEDFLRAARSAVARRGATEKTVPVQRPKALPVLLDDSTHRPVELQLLDASGESFTSVDRTEELTYVNSAPTLVFVLDPLALPPVREELGRQRGGTQVLVAVPRQEEAYGAAVDRVRAEGVNLRRRHLAVVLTKCDVLAGLPIGAGLQPQDSGQVRSWLATLGEDGFLRRMESDFGDVRYFAVDSFTPRAADDPLSPLAVLDWALGTRRAPVRFLPRSGGSPSANVPADRAADGEPNPQEPTHVA